MAPHTQTSDRRAPRRASTFEDRLAPPRYDDDSSAISPTTSPSPRSPRSTRSSRSPARKMSTSSISGNTTVQSRRSHTKSRLGCKTCKKRHIRCDETTPQCKNCTKHQVRCDYMESAVPDGIPDLKMTPQIQRELDAWRHEGIYPFPTLGPAPSPHRYSQTDLRLIHHISEIAAQMQATDASSRYAIWTRRVPMFLRIAANNEFVMHALLGLSASHLSWLTSSSATVQLAYQHRGLALQGLQQAIGNFSRHNADAVLAASILLSWQVTDWRSWASLLQGTATVIDAMQGWRHQSGFADLMEEKEYFNSGLNQRQAIIDPARDKQVASHVYQCLLPLRNYFAGLDDETRALEGLIEFIQSLYNQIPIPSAEDQFQVLHPLRTWLFFQPIDFLRRGQEEITGMVLLAHFFGVALAVEPLFPAVGAAYFGTMSVGPIEQIHQNLLVRQTTSRRSREIHDALSLMRFPLQMVKEFRDRMSWSRVDHLAATSPVGHRSTMPTHSSHQSHSPYPPETPMINYDWQAFGNFTSPTTSGGHAPQYHSPHDVHRSHAASDFIAEAMWRMER